MIFTPKLDARMGNAYMKFELNRVYMVLSALFHQSVPFHQSVLFLYFCKRSCLKPSELASVCTPH